MIKKGDKLIIMAEALEDENNGTVYVRLSSDSQSHMIMLIENCKKVVTCKDCRHWHDDGIMTTCDKNIGHGFPRDHFCADAERG